MRGINIISANSSSVRADFILKMDVPEKYDAWDYEKLRQEARWRALELTGTKDDLLQRLRNNDTQILRKYVFLENSALGESLKQRRIRAGNTRLEMLDQLLEDDLKRESRYRRRFEDDLENDLEKRGLKSVSSKNQMVACLVQDDIKRESEFMSWSDSQLKDEAECRGMRIITAGRVLLKRLVNDRLKRESKYHELKDTQLHQEARRRNIESKIGRERLIQQLTNDDMKRRYKYTSLDRESAENVAQQRGLEVPAQWNKYKPDFFWKLVDDDLNKEFPQLGQKDSGLCTGSDGCATNVKCRLICSIDSGNGNEMLDDKNHKEKNELSQWDTSADLFFTAPQQIGGDGNQKEVNPLDDYLRLNELGSGGFGTVYIARKKDDPTEKLYAIKVIRRERYGRTNKGEYEKNFAMQQKEMHKNIVHIHKVVSMPSSKRDFLVMEYCPEGDLNDYIINKNPSLDVKLGFMIDIAKGLDFLHKNKVIHRDLKPQNILMAVHEGSLICKITDFGAAKIQMGEGKFTTEIGTKMFQAPEVWLGAGYTFSADVFSLGLVYIAVYMGYITIVNDIKLLTPMIDVDGKKCPINLLEVENTAKTSEIILESCEEHINLAKLTNDMLNENTEGRPTLADEIIPRLEAMYTEITSAMLARKKAEKPGIGRNDYSERTEDRSLCRRKSIVLDSDETNKLKNQYIKRENSTTEETSEQIKECQAVYINHEIQERELASYQKLHELGRGTYGVVYLVTKQNDSSGQLFAMKTIEKGRYPYDAQYRYEREFAMQQREMHKNVVHIHKFFSLPSKRRDYLLMEYCPEGDLNNYIIDKDPSFLEKVSFMIDMANGVHFLHQNKVIHRDLKPQNVLMAMHEGSIICKITDFGVSKIQQSAEDIFSTVVGTKLFVAPEVLWGKYSYSADVFSLAVVYIAIYLRNIIETEEKYLVPSVQVDNIPCPINMLHVQYQEQRSSIILENLKENKDLGELIADMLRVEPSKRPSLSVTVISSLTSIHEQVKNTGSHSKIPQITDALKTGIPVIKQDPSDYINIYTERGVLKGTTTIRDQKKMENTENEYEDAKTLVQEEGDTVQGDSKVDSTTVIKTSGLRRKTNGNQSQKEDDEFVTAINKPQQELEQDWEDSEDSVDFMVGSKEAKGKPLGCTVNQQRGESQEHFAINVPGTKTQEDMKNMSRKHAELLSSSDEKSSLQAMNDLLTNENLSLRIKITTLEQKVKNLEEGQRSSVSRQLYMTMTEKNMDEQKKLRQKVRDLERELRNTKLLLKDTP